MTASPVTHIVLVRWKPGIPSAHLQQLAEGVAAVPQGIPGVLSAVCGPSTSPEGLEGGYEWALVVTFANGSARDGYLPHPVHEPVKRLIGEWAENVVVFDVET